MASRLSLLFVCAMAPIIVARDHGGWDSDATSTAILCAVVFACYMAVMAAIDHRGE